MKQEVIAMILQKNADKHKYNDCGELAFDCHALGGSYVVLSWLDSYCLSRDLYRETDYS